MAKKDKKERGYIKLYRSLQDHWLWTHSDPFDDRSAWVDLIMSVNHEDRKIKVGRQVITIHAGQMWTSYLKLANRWKWSKERVYRYTKMLKSDGMIDVDATPNGTLITLVNYGVWESRGNANETTNETTDKTPHKTTNETPNEAQTRTNKNEEYTNKNVEERRAAIWEAEGWQ